MGKTMLRKIIYLLPLLSAGLIRAMEDSIVVQTKEANLQITDLIVDNVLKKCKDPALICESLCAGKILTKRINQQAMENPGKPLKTIQLSPDMVRAICVTQYKRILNCTKTTPEKKTLYKKALAFFAGSEIKLFCLDQDLSTKQKFLDASRTRSLLWATINQAYQNKDNELIAFIVDELKAYPDEKAYDAAAKIIESWLLNEEWKKDFHKILYPEIVKPAVATLPEKPTEKTETNESALPNIEPIPLQNNHEHAQSFITLPTGVCYIPGTENAKKAFSKRYIWTRPAIITALLGGTALGAWCAYPAAKQFAQRFCFNPLSLLRSYTAQPMAYYSQRFGLLNR